MPPVHNQDPPDAEAPTLPMPTVTSPKTRPPSASSTRSIAATGHRTRRGSADDYLTTSTRIHGRSSCPTGTLRGLAYADREKQTASSRGDDAPSSWSDVPTPSCHIGWISYLLRPMPSCPARTDRDSIERAKGLGCKSSHGSIVGKTCEQRIAGQQPPQHFDGLAILVDVGACCAYVL